MNLSMNLVIVNATYVIINAGTNYQQNPKQSRFRYGAFSSEFIESIINYPKQKFE